MSLPEQNCIIRDARKVIAMSIRRMLSWLETWREWVDAAIRPPRRTPAAADSGVSIEEQERNALKKLYECTGGPEWKRGDRWMSDAPVKFWYGVETGIGGRITKIDLAANGLSGNLPPELECLTYLTKLDLGGNRLEDPIPPASES